MFTPMGFAGMVGFLFIPLMLWSLFWKAWALWLAARRGEKVWFGVLLVLNTMGILEILYIYVFSKKDKGCCEKSGCCGCECSATEEVEAQKVEEKPAEIAEPQA